MSSTSRPLPAAAVASLLPSRWLWVGVAVVALVGTWLRLDQLALQTLIDDEWHAVHQIIRSRPGEFMLTLGLADHSIPLTAFYWLQAQTIGLSELGMRLPLLLAGLASLFALPWALAAAMDRRVQIAFALLLAISTLLVGYSRMARPYALTLLASFLALALLARACSGSSLRWGPALAYALLAALAVWLHAVSAPFVLAPLLALGLQTLRGRGLRWAELLGVAALTGALLALALLPPLLSDSAALAAKSGHDLPNLATFQGVWFVWLGTGSVPVAVLSLLLAALGAGPVWRAGIVARWALLGLALTTATILVVRPAWVFNPLTFGRYLLPALVLLLLAVAAGIVRLADQFTKASSSVALHQGLPLALAACLGGATWATSPQPELVRHPNSHTLHYDYQFDFRPHRNPVTTTFDQIALAPFWSTLAQRPAGSLTVAVAPWRFESPAWLGNRWERTSHQRVVPAFLSGSCTRWLFGEVPADARFRLHNGIHLLLPREALAARADYIVYDRKTEVLDADGHWRLASECETWLRSHLGEPRQADSLLIWPLKEGLP